eukprot:GHVN01061480.1.p1 GENE.GHVN01061480.1~~GHVN01061480.1.p1  ORF type:complete len:150 (+),score=19.92 GHVN01061480.1:140-589(+)
MMPPIVEEDFPVKKSDSQWRDELSPEEYQILREKHTEPAGSGKYDKFFPQKGHFVCKGCGAPLFSAQAKFNSGCGWPAFDEFLPVTTRPDYSIIDRIRTEIMCAQCGGHLGHVFLGEEITEKNARHCVNSLAIDFEESTEMSCEAQNHL